jgi:hypothetical protein
MFTISLLSIALAMVTTTSQPALAGAMPKKAANVTVLPAQAMVAPNTLQWFTAIVFDDNGRPVSGTSKLRWQVSALAGQIVDTTESAALVRAGARPGSYSNAVSASVDKGGTGYASINVTGASSDPTKIEISPVVDTAAVGDARLFTASATDNMGNPVPVAGVNWQVASALGTLQSSGPLTALVQMGSLPGFYQNVITASAAGAMPGVASVVLQAGPPAQVIVSPASATLSINATQAFTAAVFDRFGNPLDPLGVTWLAKDGVTTIESFTANSVVVRAGTKAGTFADGLRAVQSGAENTAAIAVLAGPPAALTLNAAPAAIRTDGQDSSVITAQVVDAYGNATGAGAQINMGVDLCAGTCSLSPEAGVADGQGRFAATLRSTYVSSTQPLTSQIRVAATLQAGAATAGATALVAGSFAPARLFLAAFSRNHPINNHTSCTALRIRPPEVVVQPPRQTFNLYRFTAASASHTINLSNYESTGQLLIYRINSDLCASNGTISVIFVRSSLITKGSTQVTLNNLFEGGVDYLLAVQTTGVLSNTPYRFEIRP